VTIWFESFKDVGGTDLDRGSNGLNVEGMVSAFLLTDAMVKEEGLEKRTNVLVSGGSLELKYDRLDGST
jgi:hypothetical protein